MCWGRDGVALVKRCGHAVVGVDAHGFGGVPKAGRKAFVIVARHVPAAAECVPDL
jgi:hypothetical protein